MNYEKLEEMLKGKTDKELREFIKKTKECKRSTARRVDASRIKFWKLNNVKGDLDMIQRKAQRIRGERKGKDCPALEERKIDTHTYGYYKCRARAQYTFRRNREEIYTRFCHSCRLSREQVKVKMTWKGIFETR